MLSQRSTPVKMSQEAASKLPRWSLIALLVVFAFAGLWNSDFWTTRDAESFATAVSILMNSGAQTLLPVVVDSPITGHGPLTAWVSALFIALFGQSGLFAFLSDVTAHHLAAAFWFAGTTTALWYGTWYLARRPEAQPIAFAFGGEASPRDYSRVVADSTVLLFVATFGIVTRQHEAVTDTALLTMTALNFYGLTSALRRPRLGMFIAGLAAGAALLASTVFAAFWLLVGSLLVTSLVNTYPNVRPKRIASLLSGFFVGALCWPIVAFVLYPAEAAQWFSLWAAAQVSFFGLTTTDTYLWFVKNAVWYLCPIWPFVLWGLYTWRRHLRLKLTHLYVPFILVVTGLFATIFSSHQAADSVFLTFLPPMAVIAAFGLVTVRRDQENVLDWFSISIFTLGLLTLWTYWFAWLTAFAPKMAKSVQMLAPGSAPSFDSGLVLAAVTTVCWLVFVGWRLTHRPVVAWRGPWLCALGMTALVAGSIGLYHTGITLNRSYEPVVTAVTDILSESDYQKGDIVCGEGVPPALQGLFLYYGDIRIESRHAPETCRFTIHRDRSEHIPRADTVGEIVSRPHTNESFTVTEQLGL